MNKKSKMNKTKDEVIGMETIEEQISITLKEIEQMINNKEDKEKIEEKRIELDKLLKEYLENFK